MAETKDRRGAESLTPAFQGTAVGPGSAGGARPAKYHYPPPFSLRLTAEERTRLDRDAGSMAIGAYIRSRLFDGPAPARRGLRRPSHDDQLLAQALGKLGQSRIANNLNQLARAVNVGLPYLDPADIATLREACAAVTAIRRDLMQALGLERGGGS